MRRKNGVTREFVLKYRTGIGQLINEPESRTYSDAKREMISRARSECGYSRNTNNSVVWDSIEDTYWKVTNFSEKRNGSYYPARSVSFKSKPSMHD